MLHELDRPEVRTRVPPGQLLVALDSDIVEGRWAWMNDKDSWGSARWQSSTSASFMALMELRKLAQTG